MPKANSNGNGRGIPAAFYVRMSSDKQDASPQQQRDELTKLAERGGYHVATEYFDDAISGDRTDKRVQFQKMIRDAAAGKFKAILCWDQDRFGRFDSVEAGFYIHPLRQAGVKLVTVAQGEVDWTTFAGRLIYNVQQEGKHAFLRDLSRNVLRGRLAAARRGEWLSPRPYGCDIENKRLVLGDPSRVAIVRGMFREYANGQSLRGIAVELNTQGITTQRGGQWDGAAVRAILTNVAYVGDFRWGDKHVGKYNHGDELVFIRDNHPAMIDRATFDQVQRRLAQRRKTTTPKRNGGKFVFTGLCRCGKCGSRMNGRSDSGRITWHCYGEVERGICDANRVEQAELLDHVLGAIEERFRDPQTVERLRGILTRKVKERTASVDVEGLTRQLAKVDQQLTTARRNMAFAEGDDLRREYETVVRELRQERERLKTFIKTAQKPPGRTQAEADQRITKAIETLQRLRQATRKATVPKQRELLTLVMDKVEVWTRRDTPRGPFLFTRGVVHLRPDFWLAESDNLLDSTFRTKQVIKLLTIPFTAKKAA